MKRGEVWWADLRIPTGSEPGVRRPVLIVQSNEFNRSAIATVLIVPFTSNLALAQAPGNVRVARGDSGLRKTSVINVSQVTVINRALLSGKAGSLPTEVMSRVDVGLRLVLGMPA